MQTTVASCCLAVTDLDATVAFYESLGLTCTRRMEAHGDSIAVVEHPGKGGALQLSQPLEPAGPLDLGGALWKLYVNTNDIAELHAAALAAGATEDMAPLRMEQWPTSVSFVKDRDGYLVELVQRHPWQDGDVTTRSWFGQFCVNVTDLDRTVAFYEGLGLECTSRTSISGAEEAIVELPGSGGKIQLAQHAEQDGPIAMGTAMQKLYLHTDDIVAAHAGGVAAGGSDLGAPARPEAWPVTVAFVGDPDGYRIELVQPDA